MPEEIVLRQGCLYRARIELGLFEQSVENAEIGRRLVEAGFVNVVVAGEGRSRLAEGRWPLEAREAFLPEQVRSVEEVEER